MLRLNRIVCLSLLAGVAAMASAQWNLYSNQSNNPNVPQLNAQPLTDSGVAAPANSFWSEVEDDPAVPNVSNTTAGFSVTSNTGTAGTFFRLADDFVVPKCGLTLTGVKVYGYRTGLPGQITGGNLKIWDRSPRLPTGGQDPNAVLLYDSGAQGAAITDQIQATPTAVGIIYRIFNTQVPPPGTAPGTTRKLEQITLPVNPPLPLGPGTYWIDYSLDPAAAGTLFNPSTTFNNLRGIAGSNAMQWQNAANLWVFAEDTGNPATPPNVPQDLPFILVGRPGFCGVVTLEGCSTPGGVQVTVEIRNVGSTSPLQTAVVTLDSAGKFCVDVAANIAQGVYDVAVKADTRWMRKVTSSVDLRNRATFTLLTGDCNGDNEVDIGDFAILSTAFGSSPGDPNWDENADLDCDMEITIGDFALLSNNFGQSGDN